MFITTKPKARSAVARRASFRLRNFSCSWSSRTKDLTTRMAERFSCTTRFTSSVRSWRLLNMGLTCLTIRPMSTSSRGIATRKTLESLRLMDTASTRAEMSITGARTSRRMPIIRDICSMLQSLVRRVTREAVENFSMLRKEKA